MNHKNCCKSYYFSNEQDNKFSNFYDKKYTRSIFGEYFESRNTYIKMDNRPF